MRQFSLGFMLLLTALSCLAADWNEMDDLPSSYGMRIFVDDASYQTRHEIRQAWVRMDYAKPRERDGMALTSYLSYRLVNCDTRRYRVTEHWGYVVGSPEPMQLNNAMQEWQSVLPNSEADVAVAAICHEVSNDLKEPD